MLPSLSFCSFSNFFTSGTTGAKESGMMGSPLPVRYNAAPNAVTPALDAMRRRANVQAPDMALLMDPDLSIERARAMKNVRAQVNKSNTGDRVHAYGWSIGINPRSNEKTSTSSESSPLHTADGKTGDPTSAAAAYMQTSVPVPTHCRPLSGDEIGLKIWCASAVDLSGGEMDNNMYTRRLTNSSNTVTRAIEAVSDDVETASVADSGTESISSSKEAIVSLSPGNGCNHNNNVKNTQQSLGTISERKNDPTSEIAALETEISEAIAEQNEMPSENSVSTFVWICSVSQSKSKVTILNIRNNPSEVLDFFLVRTHLLCIHSVPGVKASDILASSSIDESAFGLSSRKVPEVKVGAIGRIAREEATVETAQVACEEKSPTPADSSESPNPTLDKLTDFLKYSEPPSSPGKEDIATPSSPVYQPMSSKLATMWLGGQNGVLYVHSSIAQWSHCLASLKLADSILQITHYRGRVFVALANGQCCVFVRSSSTLEWDFSHYFVIDLSLIHKEEASKDAAIPTKTSGDSAVKTPSTGSPPISTSTSIRCLEVAKGNIWMGFRNLVFIIDPKTLRVINNFPIHPRKESQVRQLSALGDGVWCSIRMDTTLRLYSAVKPFSHLQDVDIEPYVSKMLSPKAFTFIRVTGESIESLSCVCSAYAIPVDCVFLTCLFVLRVFQQLSKLVAVACGSAQPMVSS